MLDALAHPGGCGPRGVCWFSRVNQSATICPYCYVIMAGEVAREVAAEADFEHAVLTLAGPLYALSYSILRDRAGAEDAVQTAMEKGWRHWNDLRDPSRRAAWLRRICVREALRSKARAHAEQRAIEPGDAFEAKESDIDMARAFTTLSVKQRAVVVLHYHHGYPLDECASLRDAGPERRAATWLAR